MGSPIEYYDNPTSVEDYVRAFIAMRAESHQPISQEIINAASIICVINPRYYYFTYPSPELTKEALDLLVEAAEYDPEAAVTLILPYVFSRGYSTHEDVLEKFPEDTVKPIIHHLKTHIESL